MNKAGGEAWTAGGRVATCAEPAWSEAERLAALERYAILDTGRESAFDDVAELAADLLDAPIAVVNLIAADRQWFKAEVGIGADTLPLDVSVCRHAILRPGVMVVPDLALDPRFDGNPLVHAADGLRFYAGALLETPDGLPLGTVCVLDTKPRPEGISERQERALKVLADDAMARLELRRSEAIARAERARAEKHARRLSLVAEASKLLLAAKDPAAAVRDLFALAADGFRVDVGFHYRCGDGALHLIAATGLTAEQERAAARLEFGQTVCGIVAASREAMHVTGIQASDDPHVRFLKMLGLDSYFSAPLLANGELLGTLSFGRRAEPFSPGELEALRTIVAQVASAIERDHAEAEVRASERELRFALKAGRFGAWTLDLATGELTTSETCRANFGRDPDAPFTYADLRDAVHPDDKARMAAAVERSVATGEDYDIEHRIVAPAGEVRWVAIRAQVLRPPDGLPLRMAGVSIDTTERNRTEERLRESEARYRQIVEGAEDFAIVALDGHGAITAWNTGAERIIGYETDEAIGRPGAIFFTPEDREAGVPDHEMNKAQADGKVVNERWHVRKDGSRFWGSGLMMRFGQDDGGYLKIFRDRTAEHEADLRARESEARYRTLFNSIESGFCVVEVDLEASGGRIDYRVVEANPAFGRHTGLIDAEGRWLRAFRPDLEEHWYDVYGRIALTGEPERFEQGSAALGRWFDVYAFRIGAPEERRVAILFNDISARRNAEDRLRELNETLEERVEERSAALRLFQNIVQSDEAPVVAFDHAFRVTAFNKAHGRYFQQAYGQEAKVGDVLPDLFVPEQAEIVRGFMARALAGEAFTVREEFGDPAIEKIHWEISYNPLRDDAGRIIGAFHHAVDITAELRAEAELRQAQEALRQSQKMEAMGQLTGGVAHDFNNLLTPIVGALDLLQRKGLGGERERRLVAGAAQSAERAKVLVQRLLAFARRQPLQATAVDVAKLVTGMADLVSSTTGPQIKVVVDVPSNLPPAMADANQLEMALLNLSVNARDAMPDGGTLRISATGEAVAADQAPSLRPGAYVRLSIADTGMGMDERTLARAVEPFFSTKGIGKGTGLGLSMVHGLASQLGGSLRITSRPGLGTNVELWLPRSRRAAERDAAPSEAPDLPDARGTALLVDDEELVRASTADMLGELGYGVVEAASAEEALRLVDGGLRPDLVVTDHLMPGMNGTDLVRALQARRAGTPALLVSGYAEDEGVAPDLPRIVKPFRKDDLAAGLAAVLDQGR